LRSTGRTFLLLALILVLNNASDPIRAQTETSSDEADIVRVRTDLVTVPLFVADGNGQRVFGLRLDDFNAQVDGRKLKLEYFAAGTEHVALCFALDASRSMREIIRRQSEAARSLFSRFGARSRVAVWHFGSRPQLISGFIADADSVRQSFNPVVVADERTAIFDATLEAVRSFDKSGGDAAERRILILFSDGLDTASRTKASDTIKEAQQRAVSIYVVHLPLYAPRDGRLQPRPAARGFRALAESTGGRYFIIGDARAALDPNAAIDLSNVFKAIEEDLRGQYILGYYADERMREVATPTHLEISLRKQRERKLRVHVLRNGYVLK
jgi:Ca-activated chloride channel family protein